MLFFSIAIIGSVSLFNLPVELSPHAELPKLTINISWRGVSPEAVEAYLTSPIEAELAGISGVKKISSKSTEGSAGINLEFHPNVDMNYAVIEINEKLSALKKELPFGVGIPQISAYVPEDLKDLQGFITYTVSANRNPGEIRKFVQESFLFPLLSTDGIADVNIRGGEEREIIVLIDYEKVQQYNITNEEIADAVKNVEAILSAGFIKRNGSQLYLTINNNVSSAEEVNEQVVKINTNLTPVRIKDIGRVIDDYKEPSSYFRINGKETVSIIIDKEPGANTIKTAGLVIDKINLLAEELPPGFTIKKETDKSEHVRVELNELYNGAVFSIIIIIALLLIIFRSISYTLIIFTSILFSLLFAFALFYLFEISLNILTISAFILGFGFMVDNSIVVIDYLDQSEKTDSLKRIAVRIRQIFFPVFASTLTTVAVFLPLLFLTGELRIYFEQFALGIVFTLLASLLVSFTVIPMLYLKTRKQTKNVSSKKGNILFVVFNFILKGITRFKKLAITAAILIIGLPVWLLPGRIETPVVKEVYNSIFDTEIYSDIKPYVNYALGGVLNLFFNHVSRGELWSYYEPTYIIVRLELPHGNEISRINKLTKDFESEVLAYRNQIKFIAANVYSEENALIKIEFTDEQSRSSFPYILKNYLSAYAARIGGLNVGVYGYGPGFSTGGVSVSSFSVAIKGFNYNRVKELAEEFRNNIVRNPRIDNVDIDKSANYWSKDVYEIVGTIDRDYLAVQNIKIDELFGTIAKRTRGNISYNRFRIDNEEIGYSMKFTNYRDIQLDEVKNTIVKSISGKTIKIKELIDFEEKKVLSSINREDQQYIRYVAFDYKGPYKYGKEFIDNSIDKILVPEGYSITPRDYFFMFGEKDEIDILKILLIAAVLIFMVSSSLFESIKKPFLILIAVPFALIGAVFIFFLTENNIDRGAYAGMLLLIGLSVNNSIILVDYLSRNMVDGSIDRIIKLTYDRLRPIFTTTLTTAGALIPLLIGSETAFWKSLSLSVVGGILLSAVMIIILIPLFYTLLNTVKKNRTMNW